MAFVKKTWENRISEYPNRRTINDGYTTKQVTVGRDEGIVSEEGDAFNAENMNDLEDRIDAAINSVNAPTLEELTNVVISSPQSGQVLKYNGSIWVNGSGGGGGGGTDDYSDLINKPQINGVTLSGNKTTSDLNISYNDISGTPSLATVATSGDYTDLTSKPKINGEILSGNKTSADLSIPTKIEEQGDTSITTPSDGDVLRYNGNTDMWENVDSLHAYSNTEQKVGYWIDGSAIYEKTISYSSTIASGGNVTIPSNLWSQAGQPIDIILYSTSGTSKIAWRFVAAQINASGVLQIFNGRAANLTFDAFTIQYTKL